MGATGPGKEERKHALELLKVNAVLLQVRQAGVVPVQRIAAPAPVAAGQVFRLQNQANRRILGTLSQGRCQEGKACPRIWKEVSGQPVCISWGPAGFSGPLCLFVLHLSPLDYTHQLHGNHLCSYERSGSMTGVSEERKENNPPSNFLPPNTHTHKYSKQ